MALHKILSRLGSFLGSQGGYEKLCSSGLVGFTSYQPRNFTEQRAGFHSSSSFLLKHNDSFASKRLEDFVNVSLKSPVWNSSHSYSTQNVFRLSESNAGTVQPVLDIKGIIEDSPIYQDSILKRKLQRENIEVLKSLYSKAVDLKKIKDKAQKERDENTEKCQALIKSEKDKTTKAKEMRVLKEKGRALREELRDAESHFNKVNDEMVDYILSLPNTLDDITPVDETRLLNEIEVPKGVTPWNFPPYTVVESPVGPGLLAEFPIGQTAWLDIHLREKAQSFLLKGGYIETGNAEFIKKIILQGAGIDHSQFIRIREANIKKGMEHATYLAGGASFPSFLALFTQSIIENQAVLPLRYFVIGRSYETQPEKPGNYQKHAVHVLVACKNAEEMEEEFIKLQQLMENFYSSAVGISFQTQLLPASKLKLYEKKKLAFVMKKTDKSATKMVGTLSTVGDYVSKRLLCCYFDDKKQAQFLHLISAQFFDITHFLRSTEPKKVTHTHTDSKKLAAVAELKKYNPQDLDSERPS